MHLCRRRASVGRARPRAAQNLPQKRLARDGGADEDADEDADVADPDRAGPSGAAGPSLDPGAHQNQPASAPHSHHP